MSYEILEHTADVGIIAKGKTFEEALEEAARGMFSFMGESEPEKKMLIEVEREEKDELVVFFLSEIIAQCEAQGFAPADVKITSYDGKTLKAEILGENKTLKNIIKAVTFHMLEVEDKAEEWRIQVLFDV
ncbi:archease [Candidatus Micrarchaeota archaeon]|nr:archease [Candidatus Micrarchaeota archaeon]